MGVTFGSNSKELSENVMVTVSSAAEERKLKATAGLTGKFPVLCQFL